MTEIVEKNFTANEGKTCCSTGQLYISGWQNTAEIPHFNGQTPEFLCISQQRNSKIPLNIIRDLQSSMSEQTGLQ